MFSSKCIQQSTRLLRSPSRLQTAPIASLIRPLSTTARTYVDEKYHSPGKEGQHARTDQNVQFEYPEEKDFPRSTPLRGRGGMHYRRTLPTFSLTGNVGVVTGGARGLGLVMAQAMVVSGANVAIVDLNSMTRQLEAEGRR